MSAWNDRNLMEWSPRGVMHLEFDFSRNLSNLFEDPLTCLGAFIP